MGDKERDEGKHRDQAAEEISTDGQQESRPLPPQESRPLPPPDDGHEKH